ncbi:MAG: DEAD/DEAH box helicase family protein [Deltaproteobacteria bacterium]|nr:DEAD/DEAH box helicase family protein [Deltaproteobacteria bacterium]
MRFYNPVFWGDRLFIVSSWTTPLLKGPPRAAVGEKEFWLEDGPPFELVGLNFWSKAVELGTLGRILRLDWAFPAPGQSDDLLVKLMGDQAPFAASLKLLSRFRPPLEIDEPTVLLAFGVTDTGHTPLGLTDARREALREFLGANPVLGLFHEEEARFFTQGRPGFPPGKPWPGLGGEFLGSSGPSLSLWRVFSWLRERRNLPYPLEKTVFALPSASWMRRTAELLGMLPLKWSAAGSFFQGSPSSATWGDVLRAVAPSQKVEGPAEGLFPVPVLSGSLLDNVLGSLKGDFFLARDGKDAPRRHAMICGPTGTGKTLLGTFALMNECLERGRPVVYLGPTRMLVEDAALEFTRILGAVEKEVGQRDLIPRDDILVSTGEAFANDARIARGDFRVAFVVYEKVSNFFLGSDLLQSLSMALVDELHMLGDRNRGGALDATLGRVIIESAARARAGATPLRLICLSTGAMAEDKTLRELLEGPGQEAPLSLSVNERPQRLLIYIQPTSPSLRCRAFHVGRLADPALTPADFVLDVGRGAKFIHALDGWLPGHEKVIYASYDGAALVAFAQRVLSFGRQRVPEMAQDGHWLEELRRSLVRYGVEEGNMEFFLSCAQKGIFFHYSGLGRETRRLMAEGYRRFRPAPYEPFILCATETISYGVNLPADALFLENVSWPRNRFDNSFSIEALTTNEFRNLVGRVGRHGHIRPGLIPTVIINFPLGKALKDQNSFRRKREELANVSSSTPTLRIDCEDIKRSLLSGPRRRLEEYPGPLGRFYLLALLHAHAIAQKRPVTLGAIANFLENTYLIRSFAESGKAGRGKILATNLRAYYRHLAENFGDLLVTVEYGKDAPETYAPRELALNLARNGTNPMSLKELSFFQEGFSPASPWNDAALHGLKTLLLTPLLSENRGHFLRVFADPRSLAEVELKKARLGKGEALAYWKREFAPLAETLMEKEGVSFDLAWKMAARLYGLVSFLVKKHIGENFRRVAGDAAIFATVRDALTRQLVGVELSLLMWIGGDSVKSIVEKLSAFRKNRFVPADEAQKNEAIDRIYLEEGRDGFDEAAAGGVAALKDNDANEEFFSGAHTRSFNYRYRDKVALLLDSRLAFGNLSGTLKGEFAESLKNMIDRVRYGLPFKNIEPFKETSVKWLLNREEWLGAHKGDK